MVKSRVLLIAFIIMLLWGVLLGRAAIVQIFPNSKLSQLKRRQFETTLQVRSRRGAILDRNGKELAASVSSYSLYVDPQLVKNPSLAVSKLSKELQLSKQNLRKRIKDRRRRFVWIKRFLNEEQMQTIKAWGLQGLAFIQEPKRVYPNGSLLAHTLGFVGSDGSGLEGIELQYDKYLRGQLKSILLPKDARGRPLLHDGRALSEVHDGSNITLTIDSELQYVLERELLKAQSEHQSESAEGIILDPQTSEILAMAVVPQFELNEANRAPATIRRNRVVTDAFEPGSTLKTFAIAAALDQDLIRPGKRYYCEDGKMKVGDKWIREAESTHAFKWLTVSEILALSSNIGTTKIAFDVGDRRFRDKLLQFGFGQKTGVDLPGEQRGILQDLPWHPHLLSNISFGHGITVTPLQMATAYAVIANGGILRTPYIVRQIDQPNGESVRPLTSPTEQRVLSAEDAATMRLMLTEATAEHATGASARISGFPVAGKTGTAQKVDHVQGGYLNDSYVSSFVGFVPAHDPRFVIYVVINNPRKGYYGSHVAAPVFSRLAQYAVRRSGMAPVLISENNVINEPRSPSRSELQDKALASIRQMVQEEQSGNIPNLMGLSLREALARLRSQKDSQKLHLDVRGNGVVVRTVPEAGAPWAANRTLRLILENPD